MPKLLMTPSHQDFCQALLFWDVFHGIARRSWAGHSGAMTSIQRAMALEPSLKVTLSHQISPSLLEDLF
ncbi:MAG: hypothetical protein NTW94_05975 [Legionellales bacterium]|nr:hypothetical protein [Legionellales bacterium]